MVLNSNDNQNGIMCMLTFRDYAQRDLNLLNAKIHYRELNCIFGSNVLPWLKSLRNTSFLLKQKYKYAYWDMNTGCKSQRG